MKKIFIGIIVLLMAQVVYADWPSDLNRCRNITLTNVEGVEQTNFTFYINLSYDSDMQTDYDDIRFFLNGSGNSETELMYEIENATSSYVYMWVRLPYLPTISQKINVCYGNTTITTGENPTQAWDPTYLGIWHTDESTGTRYDSTRYSNDATTAGSPLSAVGKVDGGLDIENDDGADGLEVLIVDNLTTQVTLELFVKPRSGQGSQFQRWFCDGAAFDSNDYCIYSRYETAGQSIDFRVSSGGALLRSCTLNRDDTWHYVMGTYTKSNCGSSCFQIFLDGSRCGGTTGGWDITSISSEIGLGNENDQGSDVDSYFDEFRLSSVNRSLEWYNLTYNNIFYYDKVITISAEEQKPATDTCTYSGSGDWLVQCSDDCNITQTDVLNNYVVLNGTGSFKGIFRILNAVIITSVGGCYASS